MLAPQPLDGRNNSMLRVTRMCVNVVVAGWTVACS
jgi:hypothetical protein